MGPSQPPLHTRLPPLEMDGTVARRANVEPDVLGDGRRKQKHVLRRDPIWPRNVADGICVR